MSDMKKYVNNEERALSVEEPAVAYSVAKMKDISLCIPQDDIEYLENMAKLRGWTISSREDKLEESRRQAIEAFHRIRERVAESGLPEMTLDEINEEIRAAREERRYGKK